MTLNEYAAQKRLQILEDLREGREPGEGRFDAAVLREAKSKGAPQLGRTRYEPSAIVFEFIYGAPDGATVVVAVKIDAPERIVFLPVPNWVVETIWQGEVDGSYQFEGDARALLDAFRDGLEPEANRRWFGRQPPKRLE